MMSAIWAKCKREGGEPRHDPRDHVNLIGSLGRAVSINQLTLSLTADWFSWPLEDKVETLDSSADGKEAHQGKQTVRRTD